jgi:hypothetical protein
LANLTERQRNLLQLLNQLSQNIVNADVSTESGLTKNLSINLPGFNLDSELNLGTGSNDSDSGPNPGDDEVSVPEPESMLDVLRNLVNEQVEITTPFGTVTGTLLNVEESYIVMIEANGNRVLVRTDKIELITDM